ncbi:MAG: class I SAM-dependent methyltransferase [Chloroflexota bacterium]
MTNYHEQNRKSWNEATKQHHSHKPDLIARYKNGWNNLYPEDMQLLGNVQDKSIVHLQCNDGQDTLSIAKHLGANVTGVDISDEAIAFAKTMSEKAEIPAEFVRADIFEWFDSNATEYDAVYTSYGALIWISDMSRWASGIAKTLKTGGKVVVIDFHQTGLMFDYDWHPIYDAMGGKVSTSDGVGDYVADDYEGAFKNPHKAYEFAWSPSEVITALMDTGLHLTHFKEYPYMNGWQCYPDMREEVIEGEHRSYSRFYTPNDKPTIPMMYSIIATKSL